MNESLANMVPAGSYLLPYHLTQKINDKFNIVFEKKLSKSQAMYSKDDDESGRLFDFDY